MDQLDLLAEKFTVYYIIGARPMCLSIWTELSEGFRIQATHMGNGIDQFSL